MLDPVAFPFKKRAQSISTDLDVLNKERIKAYFYHTINIGQ